MRVDAKAIVWIAGRIVKQRHVGQRLLKVRQKISYVHLHDLRDQAEQPLACSLAGLPKSLGGLLQFGGFARPAIGAIQVTGGTYWMVRRDLGVELITLVLVGRHALGVGREKAQRNVASVAIGGDALSQLLFQWAAKILDEMPPQVAHECSGDAMPFHQHKTDIAERALQNRQDLIVRIFKIDVQNRRGHDHHGNTL